MNDNDISDIIANANPMPVDNVQDADHLSPAEIKLCEAIMSLPTLIPSNESTSPDQSSLVDEHQQPPQTRNPRSNRGRWSLIGAGSVAAALAALLVITLPSNDQSNIALAEWTPTPQPVSIDEQTAILDACGQSQPEFTAPLTDGVLVDRRGAFAAATGISNDTRLVCTARLDDGTWSPMGTSVESGGDLDSPGFDQSWQDDGAEVTVVTGVASDAVTVEVDAPDLPTSTATVMDGRYIVWLPRAVDVDNASLGIEIRYIDDTGQTIQTFEL